MLATSRLANLPSWTHCNRTDQIFQRLEHRVLAITLIRVSKFWTQSLATLNAFKTSILIMRETQQTRNCKEFDSGQAVRIGASRPPYQHIPIPITQCCSSHVSLTTATSLVDYTREVTAYRLQGNEGDSDDIDESNDEEYLDDDFLDDDDDSNFNGNGLADEFDEFDELASEYTVRTISDDDPDHLDDEDEEDEEEEDYDDDEEDDYDFEDDDDDDVDFDLDYDEFDDDYDEDDEDDDDDDYDDYDEDDRWN